ncbi:MAG: hypothetical protein UR68_C0024G0004 [Candidatus Roizmanbacteria bacterium GW2011_GWA2_35_19]|uniref:Uncharacterized protein n=1 Tax=Candidatus Roizmanbacteria bacterium GW2011_GWA2_35_19 TaxID=1618478 RepID=A0A0G0C701_9BACT|nr:MAG: hypothetical protein UR68_C0024G0004 [Candidatus Roizmanbacteria bacterium GW2011_GWA2_35_19]
MGALLGFIGGVIFQLFTKLGEGWISELFENRKQKKLKKIQAAKDINSFCIEGMHKNFRIKAESERHIKLKATEIEAIDEEVGAKLRQFLDLWSQCRNFLKNEPLTFEHEKIAKDYRDKAQTLGEELIKVAREWAR